MSPVMYRPWRVIKLGSFNRLECREFRGDLAAHFESKQNDYMYFLDIVSTGKMLKFKTEPLAMQAFYSTALECAVYHGEDCIAEKYHIEGENGEIVLEEVINQDAELVEL